MKEKSSITLCIMLPVRNEESQIHITIQKLKEIEFDGEMHIIVVNDGSRDNTSKIVHDLDVHVVDLEDRGFSALGRPELSLTHNSGFNYILDKIPNTDFIMIVGGDTSFDKEYIKNIMQRFTNNPNLVMAGGKFINERGRINDVRGSGRIFKKSLLIEAGGKLPFSYAWEPYLVQFAKSRNYDVKSFFELNMYTSRKSLTKVNWSNYGIGMKEMGYYWIYSLGRGIFHTFKGHPINGLKLILGYFFKKPSQLYPIEVRNFTKNEQKKRIRKIILRF